MSDLDLDAIRAAVDAHVAAGGTEATALLLEVDPVTLFRFAERLRANQLPDGGEWQTWYGSSLGNDALGHDVGNFSTHRLFDDEREFRVWVGPAQPIADVAE